MLEPIVKSIFVPVSPEAAFRRFTDEMAAWWPLASHSVGLARARTCVFEGRERGRIFERLDDGSISVWGTVARWDPPRCVAFTWHPGRNPATAQDVEVRFAAEAGGTRVDLVHGGWERYGSGAGEMHANYTRGWDFVLGRYIAGGAGTGQRQHA